MFSQRATIKEGAFVQTRPLSYVYSKYHQPEKDIDERHSLTHRFDVPVLSLPSIVTSLEVIPKMPNGPSSASGLNRNPQNIYIYSSGYVSAPSLISNHFSIFEMTSKLLSLGLNQTSGLGRTLALFAISGTRCSHSIAMR
jgi:hypothetical protein